MGRGEARENPADRYRVTVEFTAPTGSRETFITSSRNVYRDDDPGIERLAERLHERFERQQLQKQRQEEQQPEQERTRKRGLEL